MQGVFAVAPAFAGWHVNQDEFRRFVSLDDQRIIFVNTGLILRIKGCAVYIKLPGCQIDKNPPSGGFFKKQFLPATSNER